MRVPVLAVASLLVAGPALAAECRIPDPKPGHTLRIPPECKDRIAPAQASAPDRKTAQAVRSEAGAIDLGNGTTVRIGGRVRAEMGWSR